MADVLQTAREWFSPVMTILGVVYTWIRTQDSDNSARIETAEKKLGTAISAQAAQVGSLVSRVDVLETNQKHMPTHADIADMRERLAKLESGSAAHQQALEAARNEQRATRDAIESVRDFLLKNTLQKGKS
jgi:predicted  nucleic acid-binding Zn-ribbon protein